VLKTWVEASEAKVESVKGYAHDDMSATTYVRAFDEQRDVIDAACTIVFIK
jgi:hypothetical protein